MNRALLAVGLLLATGCTPQLDVGSDDSDASGGGGATTTEETGGGATSDGGGGSGGMAPAAACTPTAGIDVLEFDLPWSATMQLAILANAGEPTRLSFMGTMPVPASPMSPGCSVLDSLELIEEGVTIQKVQTGGIEFPAGSSGVDPWFETKAASAVSARCSDLSGNGRVDTIGMVARGRRDGGTFKIRVGRAESPEWGWPPAVVISCHEGLVAAPIVTGVNRMLWTDPGPATSILMSWVRKAGAPELQSFDGSVEMIPVGPPTSDDDPFDVHTHPLAPIDSSGWTWSKKDTTSEAGDKLRQITMNRQADVLGDTGCPTADGVNTLGNAIVSRVTGTTSNGPFTSEIIGAICQPYSPP